MLPFTEMRIMIYSSVGINYTRNNLQVIYEYKPGFGCVKDLL